MKTLNYSSEKKSIEQINEHNCEILNNEDLGKVRGGIMDPPIF